MHQQNGNSKDVQNSTIGSDSIEPTKENMKSVKVILSPLILDDWLSVWQRTIRALVQSSKRQEDEVGQRPFSESVAFSFLYHSNPTLIVITMTKWSFITLNFGTELSVALGLKAANTTPSAREAFSCLPSLFLYHRQPYFHTHFGQYAGSFQSLTHTIEAKNSCMRNILQ